MVGLEYILNLYHMEHQVLADKLGIKKQNINLWIKGKQSISKKHLPLLSEIFGHEEEYFQKELDDVDKLMIQKEKLRQELKPQVVDYETDITLGKDAEFIGKPIYNKVEFNEINKELEKAQLVAEFREVVSGIDNPLELQLMSQLSMLLRERRQETIFEYTIDALSHYYDVLPDWVGEPESDEFVEEFLELAAQHDKQKIEEN
ncbi:helix-turn-helix domain-containing protein [Bacillus marasmi]|uniref:helix-turn-helix domain-containing protein n=1 Tax=Bacillus marasmi TaxID=1926279 RepID=UPI0011CC75BB|nr:helix-turn-helix transcriptional regulator [Bacillus marasmi]